MKYFHGTTLSHAKEMLTKGFNSKNQYTWNCSDDNCLYMYDLDKAMEEWGQESEEEGIRQYIDLACESARITAAVESTLDTSIAVICFDSSISDLVEDDESCENMHTAVSMYLSEEFTPCSIIVLEDAYHPSLRLFFLTPVFKNHYLNTWNISEIEEKALDAMIDAGIYLEEILEVPEPKQLTVEEFLKEFA